MNNPKVSIIFVNYKTAQMTADAINSVKEKTKDVTYEIIVVDNSYDETEFNKLTQCINDTNIKIIDAKENLGFGKANNLGSQYATGKYLFFLNTDTLLINDAISILAKYLDEHSEVGVIGPNLYKKDLSPNHSYIKNEKNIKVDKCYNSLKTIILSKISHKRKDFNYTDEVEEINGYICGAALMIRKDLFSDINGFDKDIFMYAEEALLCYRVIHELKSKIYNIPSAKIIHFEGLSNNGFSLVKAKSFINGNYVYYVKTFGKEKAVQFLNTFKGIYKRQRIIAKILRKNIEKFNNLIIAIEEKLKEVRIK